MSKRSHVMQLEVLEPRQLLATVVGGGEEVGSDISFQGNTYDQILMTGASVTVSADAGQIVRVSAVDSNDDIVQYEFSGAGTMNISLDPSPVIRASSHGIPLLPRMTIRPNRIPALRSPKPKSARKSSPLRAGSRAIIGTKARSWIRSIPVRIRPWRL